MTKKRFTLLSSANEYVRNTSLVKFCYADINCGLKSKWTDEVREDTEFSYSTAKTHSNYFQIIFKNAHRSFSFALFLAHALLMLNFFMIKTNNMKITVKI